MKFEIGKVYPAMLAGDDKERSFEILSDNGNGTFDVRWDDGDEEWNYHADLERYVKNHQEWAADHPGGAPRTTVRTPGRPSLGVTKKVSLTLPEETWEWFDAEAEKLVGSRSALLRYLISREQSPESRWSNNVCLGYAILGAKRIGYTEEQTKELVRAIYSEFDWKSVDEAKAVYEQSPY